VSTEEQIRVSYGTAQKLGLKQGQSEEEPTIAYLMLPGERCRGGCSFCPQARGDPRWLSRVSWPLLELQDTIERIKESDLTRVCIQSPDVPDYDDKLISVVENLGDMKKPVSLSTPPLDKKTLESLKDPVDRVGIGVDAATDRLRKEKKRNYEPIIFWNYLGKAVDIYGDGNVTAHLIAGLGETLEELAVAIKRSLRAGASVSLFPFKGTARGRNQDEVDIIYYRRAQLLLALLDQDHEVEEALHLILDDPETVFEVVDEKKAFQTRGCPGCNRPYYTTSPGEEHKNYPREPTPEEISRIKEQVTGVEA